MTEVNPHLNKTAAGLLAQKLDAQDGTKDGKIEASIWNDFVDDKGGKKIKSSIGIVAAMNSITTYAVRMAKQAKQTATDLCMTWFPPGASAGTKPEAGAKAANGAVNGSKTQETPPANKPLNPATPKLKNKQPVTPTAEKAPEIKLKEADANVDTIVDELKDVLPSVGFRLYQGDLDKVKDALKKITSENVAYIVEKFPEIAQYIDNIDQLGWGFDEDEVFEYVLKPLQERAKYYGIASNVSEDSDLDEMKAEIDRLAPLIRDADKNAQKTFDGANAFLEEVANMTPPPEIKSGTNSEGVNGKQIKLKDLRWINVYYDDKGEISKINISHDITPDKDNNKKKNLDLAEVTYTSNKASFNTDKDNSKYEGYITEGYKFEQYKAYAEKIFGKWKAE